MMRILLLSSLCLVAAAADANAAPQWVNGPAGSIPYNCAAHPDASLDIQIGYTSDPASPLKTGDRGIVRAVAQAAKCTNGAMIEVFLPTGAVLDPTQPATCSREKLDGSKQPITDCVPWGYPGVNGGIRFTMATETLAPDWFVELQIPVIYTAELLGPTGGATHALGARVNSLTSYGDLSLPMSVAYRAELISSGPSSLTTSTAQLDLNLFSYNKGGQLVFDFGTTNAFGQSTPPAQVPAGSTNFPSANAMLQGLTAGTTYFWRARFLTTSGTFTSQTLAFTTPVPVLSVATAGSGLGKVTSDPAGIDCGARSSNTCAVSVAPGITIALYATPSTSAYTFTGWSGACSGTGRCVVSMADSRQVTANFAFFDPREGTPLPDPTPRR